jgi:phage protein D
MLVEMLAYVARRNISPEAARALHRLPQSRSNDGRALASVDLAEIEHKPLSGRSRQVDAFAMKACIDSLQKELAKVEAMAVAQHLVAELLKATADAMADAMAARESMARLEGELLELRSRPWWRRLAG